MEDFYKILSVEPTASQVEIEQAVNKLSSEWQANRRAVSPAKKSQMLSQIKQARAILTDPLKRLEYDVELGVRRNFSGQTRKKNEHGIPLRDSMSIEHLKTIKIPTELDYDKLNKAFAASADVSPVNPSVAVQSPPHSYSKVEHAKTGLPVDLYIGPEAIGKKFVFSKAVSENVDTMKQLSREKISVIQRRHTVPYLDEKYSQVSPDALKKTESKERSSIELNLQNLKERTAKTIAEVVNIDPTLPPLKKSDTSSIKPIIKQTDSKMFHDDETENNNAEYPIKNDMMKEDKEAKNKITTGILGRQGKDLYYSENSRKTHSTDTILDEKRIKQHSTEKQKMNRPSTSMGIVPLSEKSSLSKDTLTAVVKDSIQSDVPDDKTEDFRIFEELPSESESGLIRQAPISDNQPSASEDFRIFEELPSESETGLMRHAPISDNQPSASEDFRIFEELPSESETGLMGQAQISDTRKVVPEENTSTILQSSTGSLDDNIIRYDQIKRNSLTNEKLSSKQKLLSNLIDPVASKEYGHKSGPVVNSGSNSKVETKSSSESSSKTTANNTVKSRTSNEQLQNYLEELKKITSSIKIILDNKMQSSNDIPEKRVVFSDVKETASENDFLKLSSDFKDFLRDLNDEKELDVPTKAKTMQFVYQYPPKSLGEDQSPDLKATYGKYFELRKSMTEPFSLNRVKNEEISSGLDTAKGAKSEDRYILADHAVEYKDNTQQISDGSKKLPIIKRFSPSEETAESPKINKSYVVSGLYNTINRTKEAREKIRQKSEELLTKKKESEEKDTILEREADYDTADKDSLENESSEIKHIDSYELTKMKLSQRRTESDSPVLYGRKSQDQLKPSLHLPELRQSHSERYLSALKLLEKITNIAQDRKTLSIDSFKKILKDDPKRLLKNDSKVTFSDTQQVFMREESVMELPTTVRPKEASRILESRRLISDFKESVSTSDLSHHLGEYYRKELYRSSEELKASSLISYDHQSSTQAAKGQTHEKNEVRTGDETSSAIKVDTVKEPKTEEETKSPRPKQLEKVEKKMVVKDWREYCSKLFPMPIKVKDDPRPPQFVSACTRIAGADLKTVYNFGPDLEFIEVYVNDELRAKIVKDQQQDVYWNTMKRDDLPFDVNICAATVISANDCIITTEIARRGKRESITVYKNDVLLCRTGNTVLDEDKRQ